MASLASINVKFTADLKQFSSEMQSALRDIKRTGEEFQKIGSALSIGLTLPLLAVGAASVKLASDYEESLNKVNVAFGNSASSIESFGNTTLETFGIAKGTALDMASLFGDMATSMGLPQSEAAELSKSLVGLAGDLASFKNIGIEQATTALNGVFTGETESLKLLGIVMTEANLAQFALEKGIQKNIKSFTQAEKVQLRYAYVMENTKNAQGDFARTSGGAANQMRVFQESLKEVGQQFGAIILPAFTNVVKSLNGMVKSFGDLSPGVKQTIVVVAGLVAVIGPLLTVIGTVLTLVPSMVAGFAALKLAVASLTATIAANPLGLLLVGLTSVIAYLAITNDSFDATINKINESTDAVLKQNEASQKLGDEVKKLVDRYDELKAKSKLTKEEQKELSEIIVKIGKVVPGAVTEVNKYGEALEINAKKAREFTDSQKELIALRTKKQLEDSIVLLNKLQIQKKGLTISEQDLNSKYVEGIGFIKKRNGVLEVYNKILGTSRALTLEELILFKEKVVANEKNIATTSKNINTLKGLNTTQADSVESTDKLKESVIALNTEREKTLKPGTIDFYENEISKLKKLQKEQVTTKAGYNLIQNEINALQVKIDALSNVSKAIEPIVIKTEFEGVGLAELPVLLENVNNAMSLTQTKVAEMNASLSEAFTSIAESAVENLAVGFGEAIASMVNGANVGKTLAKFLLDTIGDLMIQLGKAAIQIGITMTAIKSAFATPFAAIATGVALVAFGTLIKSAVPDDFQKFADGGIVGGTSYYGDKILARVNSGELILNSKQQQSLYGMLAGASGSNVNIGVQDILLDGNKIRIVLDRTDKINNRKR